MSIAPIEFLRFEEVKVKEVDQKSDESDWKYWNSAEHDTDDHTTVARDYAAPKILGSTAQFIFKCTCHTELSAEVMITSAILTLFALCKGIQHGNDAIAEIPWGLSR